jgi:CRP/FNR family transcriptional regulator, cyclic AMP receptor protein
MPIDSRVIDAVDHLRDLDAKEKAALADRIELVKYNAGETIFSYGDPGHALYIIHSGEVEIYVKNDKAEKIVLEVSKPGDLFGEISLLDDGPRTAWVTALSDVELLRLDREHFEDYIRLYTPAALHLLSVAARRLRRSDEFIRRTVTRNANDVEAERQTLPELIADTVSSWSGSLRSVAVHVTIFGLYMVLNLGVFQALKAFDPYPFGLLSVIVGMECILLTLFVLASQNRQRERDSIRSDVEFETSINTELKIAYMHEKIDRLIEDNSRLSVSIGKLLER